MINVLALMSNLPDFEDALQCESAIAAGCEIIVTRDKKHFRSVAIPVLSPEAFLQYYAEQENNDYEI